MSEHLSQPNQYESLPDSDLLARKDELLFIYNTAEQVIHSEGGTPLDYTALNEAENCLFKVQEVIDQRGIESD